jgi:hypothetical protein
MLMRKRRDRDDIDDREAAVMMDVGCDEKDYPQSELELMHRPCRIPLLLSSHPISSILQCSGTF